MYRMHTASVSEVGGSSRVRLPGLGQHYSRVDQLGGKKGSTEQIRIEELGRPMRRIKYLLKGQANRNGRRMNRNKTALTYW
mgnify:CR=1 FL=1